LGVHFFSFSAFQLFSISAFLFNLSHFSISVFSISAFLFSFSPYFPHFRLATRHQSRYLFPCPRVRRNPHPERSQEEIQADMTNRTN
jgi:hypothetical protein